MIKIPLNKFSYNKLKSFKDKHLIELPRKILVGYDTIESLGEFIQDFGFGQKILIISGFHVNAIISSTINKLLKKSNFNFTWQLINSATIENVNHIVKVAKKKNVNLLIGLGGGKSVDVAKLSASKTNLSAALIVKLFFLPICVYIEIPLVM